MLLATQTALLGMVSDRIRAVLCGWSETRVLVQVVYDGQIDDDEREMMSEVQSEILSHFPEHEVDVECLRIDVPQPIPTSEAGVFVFKRREN